MKTRVYLLDYVHKGKTFGTTLEATDENDAWDRLMSIRLDGIITGEQVSEIEVEADEPPPAWVKEHKNL